MRVIQSMRKHTGGVLRRVRSMARKGVDVRSLQQRLERLESELHRETERLDFLVNFMRDLSLDLDTLLSNILKDMAQVLPAADMGAIYLYDPAQVLRVRACYGYADEESLRRVVLKPGDSLSGKVFVSGRPLLARSPQEIMEQLQDVGPQHIEIYAKATRGRIGESIISAPLRTSTAGVIGTIAMTSTHTPFSEDDLALLEGVGGQIAQAVANAQLFSDLSSSEDRYRNLVEDISLGVTESTPDGELLYFNPRACEILGVDQSELQGLRSESFWFDTSDRAALLEEIEVNGFLRFEIPVRRADGRKIWIAGSVRANREKGGELARFNAIFDDVTERHHREARTAALNDVRKEVWRMRTEDDIGQVLAAVNASLRTLEVPFFRCGLAVVDGRELPSSVHFHNLTSAGKLSVPSGKPSADHRVAAELIVKFWTDGEPAYRPDLQTEDPYGERARLGDVRCLLDVPFSHGTLALNSREQNAFSEEDIQFAQQLAEVLSDGFHRLDDLQRLTEERERLVVTLRSIGDGVITIDGEGKVSLINRVAEDLTGWTLAEAEGLPLAEVYRIRDEDSRKPAEDPVTRVMEIGVAISRTKMLLMARDNSVRNVADSSAPIRDREGRTLGMVVVFRDVTDQSKREEEHQRSAKIESLGVLAGGIAHDFNNILTAITGSVSLAKLDLDPTNRLYETLGQVEEASHQAAALTQQLLTFSKGGAPIKRLASISELIRDSATFALRGSNVRCEFDIADTLWPAEVDSGQMSQVVHNLVINANQAMPEGGVIRLEAGNREVNEDDSLPLKPGPYARIVVSDEGMGIALNHLQRIFEPYFSTKQRGSGLGLATVHSIVTNHGGHITVSSRSGQGTTFTLFIPASTTGSVPAKERTLSLSKGAGKVLVMDDDDSVRASIGKMLRRLGYDAEFAEDGAEALALYASASKTDSPFDAVIADLTIPGGMGGKDLIGELRQMDPQVRAIVSSGYSRDPVMAHASRFGFSGVMAKPYTLTELGRVLHEVIDPNGAQADAVSSGAHPQSV